MCDKTVDSQTQRMKEAEEAWRDDASFLQIGSIAFPRVRPEYAKERGQALAYAFKYMRARERLKVAQRAAASFRSTVTTNVNRPRPRDWMDGDVTFYVSSGVAVHARVKDGALHIFTNDGGLNVKDQGRGIDVSVDVYEIEKRVVEQAKSAHGPELNFWRYDRQTHAFESRGSWVVPEGHAEFHMPHKANVEPIRYVRYQYARGRGNVRDIMVFDDVPSRMEAAFRGYKRWEDK